MKTLTTVATAAITASALLFGSDLYAQDFNDSYPSFGPAGQSTTPSPYYGDTGTPANSYSSPSIQYAPSYTPTYSYPSTQPTYQHPSYRYRVNQPVYTYPPTQPAYTAPSIRPYYPAPQPAYFGHSTSPATRTPFDSGLYSVPANQPFAPTSIPHLESPFYGEPSIGAGTGTHSPSNITHGWGNGPAQHRYPFDDNGRPVYNSSPAPPTHSLPQHNGPFDSTPGFSISQTAPVQPVSAIESPFYP